MADYDVILNEQLKKAEEEAEKYSQRRRQQADSYAARVGEVYDGLISSAERDYMKSANDTAASYRDAYDANAVSELVARRNAKEAIANAGASNSGLNATQSTAISLMRGNADAQVTANKQAAVDSIMRELDALRSEYRSQAADAKNKIYGMMDQDIQSNWNALDSSARDRAVELYQADREAETAKQKAELEQARWQSEYNLKWLKQYKTMEEALKAQQEKETEQWFKNNANASASSDNKPSAYDEVRARALNLKYKQKYTDKEVLKYTYDQYKLETITFEEWKRMVEWFGWKINETGEVINEKGETIPVS